MKWLQDNPLGISLAGFSGVLLVVIAVLALVRSLPVTVEVTDPDSQQASVSELALTAHQVGALKEYEVINQKPVFNESRLPVVAQLQDDEQVEDSTIEVQDAPDVRLTGVIITPELRMASLTPTDGKKGATVTAREGEALTGKFVGWQVSTVRPRNVLLESQDGQKLDLELKVHDDTIKAPRKPKPAKAAKTAAGGKAGAAGEPPLSRAEQIRQRIAERREELRREQEDQQAQGRNTRGTQSKQSNGKQAQNKPAAPSDYQNAINALMNSGSNNQTSGEKKDG